MKALRILHRKDGMALLTVLIIFLVLVIMLGGMSILTNSNLKQSVVTKNHTAAFYSSEAGLTKASAEFETELDNLVNQSPSLSSSAFLTAINSYITSHGSETITLSTNNGKASYADVTLVSAGVDGSGYQNYVLTSLGFVGDLERVLKKIYKFKYIEATGGNGFIVDKAVMVKGKFTLTGSAQIIGAPISTYSKVNSAISMDWSTKVLGIELDPSLFNAQNDLINNNIFNNIDNINGKITSGGLSGVEPLDEVFEFPLITLPGYPNKTTLPRLSTYTNGNLKVTSAGINMTNWTSDITYNPPSASSTYYVPTISIANNSNFTVNIGTSNITWITDKIVLNGPLQVIGNGTLTIYLTGNAGSATTSQTNKLSYGFTGGSGYIGNITNPEKVKLFIDPLFYRKKIGSVYVDTPITTTIGGASPLYISLMAANLNLNLTGSGRIDGYVVTGGTSVIVSGGSSTSVALYYAPNAKFVLSGGADMIGSILADSFEASGGTRVTYSDVAFENFPFEVLDPITGGTGGGAPVLDLLKGSTIEQ